MSNKNLVICDQEPEYAMRLAGYLGDKRELAMQIKVCAEPEQVALIQKEMPIDLLLIDDRMKVRTEQIEGIPNVIWLSSKVTGIRDLDESNRKIFRYQSGDEIYAILIQLLAENGLDDSYRVRKKKRGRLIGVYSPVKRTGQTTFAIQKGKDLSKEENVLYISLESYAGIGGMFPKDSGKNLSHVLYYAKQETGNLGLIITTMVRTMEHLDYIPPVVFPEDICSVQKEEWLRICWEILEYSIYNTVILDLSDSVQGLFEILRECDEIYIPTVHDKIAISKIYQFEEVLERQGFRDVLERMIRCDIRRTTERKGSEATGSVQGSRRR